eukprot:3913350-Alexandrium_andersonii.AAC.1
MSASLVGSEMCIRDSLCNSTGATARKAAENRRRQVSAVSAVFCAPLPVSYTHLTLPTICSV